MFKPLDRRTFLRAGAVSVTLPFLDAMQVASRAADAETSPKRLVIIQRPLGTYAPFLFPETSGPQYESTRLLKHLDDHRGRFTVFSGVSHPGYPNNHGSEYGLLTAAPPEAFKNWDDIHNTISLDQEAAEHLGRHTRFPSLLLGGMGNGLSYSRNGVPLPGETNRAAVFKRLFLNGTPDQISREVRRLQDGQSILDGVAEQLRSLQSRVSRTDRQRLDLLASTIREAETSLHQDEAWSARPKPKIDYEFRDDASEWVGKTKQLYELIHLATQTDSTRVIVHRMAEQSPAATAPGTRLGEHDASHHGKDPQKIEQVGAYEDIHFQSFRYLLDKLAATPDGDGSLLDHTQVLFLSNLGDASAHASTNLPVVLAGGGYRHQGHMAFDREKNYPLANLYARMLQQLGIERDRFSTSTGVLSELS